MFNAQKSLLNLAAPPRQLTTRDMFIPTCATCHMSGLNGLKVTHDPTETAVLVPCQPYFNQEAELSACTSQHAAGLQPVPHHADH